MHSSFVISRCTSSIFRSHFYKVIKQKFTTLGAASLAPIKKMPVAGLAIASLFSTPVFSADTFPSKPIDIVVTFPPGGGTDMLARLVGNYFNTELGQQAIVDNRPGASGNIGARVIAQRPADGYSLLMVNSSFAVNPAVFSNLPFDPKKDFDAVINFATVPSVILVPQDSPFKSMDDLISKAKSQSGAVLFGSCGNGTPQHLAGEMLNLAGNFKMTHVPYSGCGPALKDVLGNQVGVAFVTASSAIPFIKDGKVRALAVTSAQRNPLIPDVPAVSESGYPDYALTQWHGLLVPAGTPKPVIEKLYQTVQKIVERDDIKARLTSLGYTQANDGPAEFKAVIDSDIDRFKVLAQQIGLQMN